MNEPTQSAGGAPAEMSREEMMAAMFANMVIQQTNMAMMLLGKVAHPETGEFVQDFETAQMFIGQLEMLEAKTKGNLSKQEEALLKQALGTLRMTFVEAVNGPAEKASAPSASAPASAPAKESAPTPAPAPADSAPAAADESRKKFTKKY